MPSFCFSGPAKEPFLRLWFLLLSLCWWVALPLSAAEQVLFAAEPSWRQMVEIPSSSRLSPINGQRYLLVDRQSLDLSQPHPQVLLDLGADGDGAR